MYINLPRENISWSSLLNSFLDLTIEVLKKADNSSYANGKNTRLVNLGPLVLFSNFQLTTSSGKHLEDFNQTHVVSLMYKELPSSRASDDLSIGFDRDRKRKRDELTINKIIKVKYHVGIILKGLFGFAEY